MVMGGRYDEPVTVVLRQNFVGFDVVKPIINCLQPNITYGWYNRYNLSPVMVGLWQPGFPTTFTGVSSQELINHRKTLHINCEPLQRSHAEAWYSWCTQWYLVVATLITRFWCQTQTMHLLPALHHLQKMSYEPMASLDDSWRGRKLGDQSQQWSLERRKGVFSVHCFCARSMTIMVSCPVDPQVMWSWSEASSSRNAILEISPMHSLTTTKMPRSKGSSVDFVSKTWEVHRKHIYIFIYV